MGNSSFDYCNDGYGRAAYPSCAIGHFSKKDALLVPYCLIGSERAHRICGQCLRISSRVGTELNKSIQYILMYVATEGAGRMLFGSLKRTRPGC